ncbi:hypothetical protein [Dokdonella sp.]|uniref:hypothetical protein n=1 Tax=Dokdonella sp. TaxID=2291710 RepID=UPI001B0E172D|nr:hypothetical protein [Dokdonella sp.]MBO9662377.1 hypothetical protein [Dokdonella sp.]
MKRIVLALLTAIIAASLISGCGFLRKRSERKNNEYKMAVEERPLEIPPGLDMPNTTGALTIPGAAGSSSGAVASSSTETPPADGSSAVIGASGAGVALGGDGLRVTDNVESTWSRVGLALERSGAATIVNRDESGRTYTVQTTGQTTVKPGWFKRAVTLGMAGTKKTAQVQLTVRVSADGDGSKVGVEGANDEASRDAARALLATLRERLS